MSDPLILVLGTKNAGKAAEFRDLLQTTSCQLLDLSAFGKVPDCPEEGASLAENSRAKARYFAMHLRQWVLADDTGLHVEALDGRPGVHSARFAGPGATAEANRRRLLEELGETPLALRGAQFVCHLTLADPAGCVRAEAIGTCRGRIRFRAAGARGFGYDSLFEIVEYGCTLAELGEAAASCLTHRARAAQQLQPALVAILLGSLLA